MQFTTVTGAAEVDQILELQAQNLASALTAEAIAAQGFVTVRHERATLLRMNEQAPSVIARAEGRLAGYALVMPREFAPEVPILAPMFAMLSGLAWNGRRLGDNPRWFVMGQICVAAPYRGHGVFDGLYATMREVYRADYDFTVTEVAERNRRSLRAHERVGFRTLHTYPDATTGEVWRVIVLPF
jgi:L-amino acid N-acyltransferase YncA